MDFERERQQSDENLQAFNDVEEGATAVSLGDRFGVCAASPEPNKFQDQMRAFYSGETNLVPVFNIDPPTGAHKATIRRVTGEIIGSPVAPPDLEDRIIAVNKYKIRAMEIEMQVGEEGYSWFGSEPPDMSS